MPTLAHPNGTEKSLKRANAGEENSPHYHTAAVYSQDLPELFPHPMTSICQNGRATINTISHSSQSIRL